MEFVVENAGKINIIFLHGWGADYKSFYFLKDLLKGYSLHFASLDGFGGTKAPYNPTICGYSQRLKQYIANNNLKNIVLVGHSFGGRVAIEYACQNNVLGIVLVNSAGIKPRFSIKKQYKIAKYKIAKFLARHNVINKVRLKNFGSSDYKIANDQMKAVLANCIRYNQRPLLKHIETKCLIYWGEKDKETPLYMAKTLHKHIKNSKLVIQKDCGHFSFLDNQYAFYINLLNFLDNLKGENYE